MASDNMSDIKRHKTIQEETTMDYFKRVSAQTPTRFWINNVTRAEAQMAIDNGAVGCTQNPSFAYKMLVHPLDADHAKDAV